MYNKKEFTLAIIKLRNLSLKLLYCFSFYYLTCNESFSAEYFNPNALEVGINDSIADINTIVHNEYQLPGTYRVDIYINNQYFDRRDISFQIKNQTLTPQLDKNILSEMGVLLPQHPDTANDKYVFENIPDAKFHFSFNKQRLDLQFPQATLRKEARNFVDPALWQQGLPAAIVNYSYTGSQNSNDSYAGNNNYLNLRSGLNLGSWRIRNYSSLAAQGTSGTHWDTVYSFIQRDVQALQGQLIIGDSNSPGDITDSIPFSGIQLSSDDNQLPDSMRGFAPIIRGIAKSNAQVTIKQNGYIIYQAYVPPGPFEIEDLFPTSSQGDLDVTIKESDGSERSFTQPFSAVPIMQREGRLKYGATLGKYRSQNSSAREPDFGLLSLIYGLSNRTTIYGGTTLSDSYHSGTIGMGFNLETWGAVSVDVTKARTATNDDQDADGQSYRLQYSKNFLETGTSMSFGGYQYSSSGYYDFIDSNEIFTESGFSPYSTDHKRSRFQANINQNMGNYGSLYLFAYLQDYWDNPKSELNINSGYNVNIYNITWNLNYARSKYSNGGNDEQQLSLTIQVPLSKLSNTAWAIYNMVSDERGSSRQQLGISDTVLSDKNLSYSINQGYDNELNSSTGNASLAYKGTYNELRTSYNYNKNNRQFNFGIDGGIVAHPYGITFSQPVGDTIALVRAPGASNVKVENRTGVYTDWRGYAIVPYVSTYKKNRIALNTQSLPEKIDIDVKVQTVIPTQGALVLADFNTRVGEKVLLTLHSDNKLVPFGAIATLEQDNKIASSTGIVSTDGQLYMSGMPESGKLSVRWGKLANQQCVVNFTLPPKSEQSPSSIVLFTAKCI